MRTNVILDTGPLVALFNSNDAFHLWTIETLAPTTAPLLTCEPVITEACYLLNKISPGIGNSKIMSLLERKFIKISFDLAEQFDRVHQLSLKYSDTPMDFADACVVRMTEVHATSSIMTLDSDFRIYRKNDKKMLSLHIPPER